MIRVGPGEPAASALDALARKQSRVDAHPTYEARVAAAKRAWASGNRSTQVFTRIKRTLTQLSPGLKRCVYCEDSEGREIEHVHPKDWCPERVFRFDNYVFACGGCNGPKGNRYGVVHGLQVEEQHRGDQVVPPRDGPPALLDPRVDDPLAFLELDLSTFRFLVRDDIGAGDAARARFTLEVLHLNDRDHLIDARRSFYRAYVAGLRALADDHEARTPQAAWIADRDALVVLPHLTVLVEMWRQRRFYADLEALFARVPDVDRWPVLQGVEPLP